MPHFAIFSGFLPLCFLVLSKFPDFAFSFLAIPKVSQVHFFSKFRSLPLARTPKFPSLGSQPSGFINLILLLLL